jgi:BCCT, betaine/carnitine/choline family transporter
LFVPNVVVDRVAWAPFVGVFVATISKGRKVRDVVLYGLFVPVGYCLVFFCVMGGVGLRQARQALELQQVGAAYFNNSNHFLASNSGICYDVPQSNVVIDDVTVFTNRLYGVTPVCLFDNDNADYGAYNIFYSFRFPDTFSGHGMGTTLSLLFIFASMLHSVRSCDTVSLVVDSLASTGRKNSHWSRRMFWSITIGALAAALLSTGGRTALRAVQAASVLCGLPFSVVLCYMLQCILLMCRAADQTDRLSPRYTFPDQAEFSMPLYGGIFNILEYTASLGKVNAARVELGMHRPSKRQVIEFGKGLVVPYVSLYQVLSSTYPESAVSNACLAALYMTCFFGWIGCLSAARGDWPELVGIGWTLFVATGGILCHVRSTFRAQFRIRSNVFADVLSSCFLWPQVLTQMLIHCDAVSSSSKPKPKEDRPTG